jgi:hypothetical protein
MTVQRFTELAKYASLIFFKKFLIGVELEGADRMTDATHRGRTLNRRSLVLGGVSSAAAAAALVPRGKSATYE